MAKKAKTFDFGLFLIIMTLLVIGNIMVLSASGPSALNETGNSYYYFTKQLMFSVIGVFGMLGISMIDFRIWKKFAKIGFIISIILLLLVLVIGSEINGAKRWIDLGFTTFQASEFVKIAMIVFFSYMVAKHSKKINNFKTLVLNFGLPICLVAGLLLLEPHKSATIIICLTSLLILIVGGLSPIWWGSGLIGGAVLGSIIIFMDQYSAERVLIFLNPWQDPLGAGYQIIQSLYAIGSGGLFGKGLGKSIQKYDYIPEPHNDFIFAIVAEELGFIAVLGIIVLFILLIWKGLQISTRVSDTFGSLLAVGLTSLIAVQVIFNIAVVTSSMPVTGIPLPFFSYGGTSIFFVLIGMGILLNISKHTTKT